MRSKVAILGKLPSKFKAPFDDDTWDIWTLNRHVDFDKIPRVDLLFDIHAKYPNQNADITRENYPFKEAEKLLGGQYFNNSISYMIAYAILKGYKEIRLYGIRYLNDQEAREKQKENCRELCFFARGKGIKVSAPYDKDFILAEYPLYGL